MNNIYVNIIMLVFIITYIVDFSGIIVDLSKKLYSLTHKGISWNYQMIKKPFNCSGCMVFWTLLFYLLYKDYPIIHSLFVSVLGSLSTNIVKIVLNYYIKITFKK